MLLKIREMIRNKRNNPHPFEQSKTSYLVVPYSLCTLKTPPINTYMYTGMHICLWLPGARGDNQLLLLKKRLMEMFCNNIENDVSCSVETSILNGWILNS